MRRWLFTCAAEETEANVTAAWVCACVSPSVWFSVPWCDSVCRGGTGEWNSFPFLNQARNIWRHCSSAAYSYQHTQWSHVIKRRWREKSVLSSQNSWKKKFEVSWYVNSSEIIHFLQIVNANNNSRDSGSGIVLARATFSPWLSPLPPFPKDILPNNRTEWFILAHVAAEVHGTTQCGWGARSVFLGL